MGPKGEKLGEPGYTMYVGSELLSCLNYSYSIPVVLMINLSFFVAQGRDIFHTHSVHFGLMVCNTHICFMIFYSVCTFR